MWLLDNIPPLLCDTFIPPATYDTDRSCSDFPDCLPGPGFLPRRTRVSPLLRRKALGCRLLTHRFLCSGQDFKRFLRVTFPGSPLAPLC